nr:hypothetical protein CFP56_65487 [Quercus suber]
MFRDQSQSTAHKATIRNLRACARRTTTIVELRQTHAKPTLSPYHTSMFEMPPVIQPSPIETARSYFTFHFQDHIDIAGNSGKPGDDLLISMGAHRGLSFDAALRATSLACYAKCVRSFDLQRASHRAYVEAISLLNKSLSCAATATHDATLFSINLLQLYEVFTGDSKRSISDWAAYIKGAATILKLRGRQQFRSSVSRQVSLHCVRSLLICCLQQNMRLPDCIEDIVASLAENIKTVGCGIKTLQAMVEFNQLRHDVRNGILRDCQRIITRALRIDRHLSDTCANYSSSTCGSDMNLDSEWDQPHVLGDSCHRYYQLPAAKMLNYVRTVRVLLHAQVRHTIMAESEHSACALYQLDESTNICRTLQYDILASVPRHLGLVSGAEIDMIPLSDSNITLQAMPLQATNDNPEGPDRNSMWRQAGSCSGAKIHFGTKPLSLRVSSAIDFIWPLWIAGMIFPATPEMKAYCANILSLIGAEVGIGHALVLSNLLRSDTGHIVWKNDT